MIHHVDPYSWRGRCIKAMQPVIDRRKDFSDPAEYRKALNELYPFGEREMHPYKIWLSELKRQVALAFPVKLPPCVFFDRKI